MVKIIKQLKEPEDREVLWLNYINKELVLRVYDRGTWVRIGNEVNDISWEELTRLLSSKQNNSSINLLTNDKTIVGAINELKVTVDNINTLISSIPKFDIDVVKTLPTEDISTSTIYLVPKVGSGNDVYEEYIYVNNNWELIGNTSIDLTDYAKTSNVIALDTEVLINAKKFTTDEIAKIPKPDVSEQIKVHNENTESHQDIRDSIKNFTVIPMNVIYLTTDSTSQEITTAFGGENNLERIWDELAKNKLAIIGNSSNMYNVYLIQISGTTLIFSFLTEHYNNRLGIVRDRTLNTYGVYLKEMVSYQSENIDSLVFPEKTVKEALESNYLKIEKTQKNIDNKIILKRW